jgi:hypothetical protein
MALFPLWSCHSLTHKEATRIIPFSRTKGPLISPRAPQGWNRPSLYCPWFPINSSFETRPQCYCLRHSWPELHDRPAPSRTKRTERSLSLIHRFSSGQGAHSGAIVCSKDQRHLRMMERGSGRYAGRKICKDQQR